MTDHSTAWYREYGVDTDPFRHQSGVFYSGAQRRAHLDILHHLCHFSNLVLLLLGEKGIGKSRLVEQLLQEEGDALSPLVIRPALLSGAERLLRQIAGELGVVDALAMPEEQLLGAVGEHLRHRAGDGSRVLLVVEDAQSLADESLALLLTRFQPWVDQGLLSLLLLADPDFETECKRWSTRLGRTGWFHLVSPVPLSETEVREYLELRLKAAGWNGNPPVPKATVRQLYVQSGGNPAQVHRLAPALLQRGPSSTASRTRSGAFWKSSWPWITLASVLLLGSFVLVALQYQKEKEVRVPVAASDPQPDVTLQMDEDPVLVDLSQLLDQAESRLQEEMGQEPLPEPGISDEQTSRPGAPQERETTEAAPELGADSSLDSLPEESTLPGAESSIATEPGPESAEEADPGMAVQEGVTGPAEPSSGDVQPEPSLPQEPPEVVLPEKEPATQAERVKPEAAEPGLDQPAQLPSLHPAYRSARWLMQQPPDSYTVQFLASYNEETAQAFIDELSDGAGYLYIRTDRKGRDWYVVLRGLYPDRAAARDAINRLPAPLRKLGPWVRQIRDVQQDARAGD